MKFLTWRKDYISFSVNTVNILLRKYEKKAKTKRQRKVQVFKCFTDIADLQNDSSQTRHLDPGYRPNRSRVFLAAACGSHSSERYVYGIKLNMIAYVCLLWMLASSVTFVSWWLHLPRNVIHLLLIDRWPTKGRIKSTVWSMPQRCLITARCTTDGQSITVLDRWAGNLFGSTNLFCLSTLWISVTLP